MRQRAVNRSALRRLGMATPPAFVGRDKELASLFSAITERAVVVVHGAAGSGKTRLAQAFALSSEVQAKFQVAYLCAEPGDRGRAICARAERIMNLLPGGLAYVMERDNRLLIIDDAHILDELDTLQTLAEVIPGSGAARGRVLLLSRDSLVIRRAAHVAMPLHGLSELAARQLWHHLEEAYGPTPQRACDDAIIRTRGLPLAMRREYARAAFGPQAWSMDEMPDDARRVLRALAVLRRPAAPDALDAIAPGMVEDALAELIARQLIDALDDGRFAVHNVVRQQVLDAIEPDDRISLELRAADHIAAMDRGHGEGGHEALDAVENTALGHLDAVDRLRERVLHLLAAGEPARAAAELLAGSEVATLRGSGGEVLSLIELIRDADAAEVRQLEAVRAGIAARHGRVAEALEICVGSGTGGTFDPVESATLCYRSGDVTAARRQLAGLLVDEDAGLRCRAAAIMAEIELACGNASEAESLAQGAFVRDRAEIDESIRARLHMALAAVEEHAGRIGGARAALSRAASSGRLDPALSALIEARRSACLAREGRVSEAETSLAQAEQGAREVDAIGVADEIRRCRSLVALRRGDTLIATHMLRDLVAVRRQRGDEIGALHAEIDLSRVLARRGELAQAAELVSACTASAARRKLQGMAAEVQLVGVMIDLAELRLSSASVELDRIAHNPATSAEVQNKAAMYRRLVDAWRGETASLDDAELHGELVDDIDVAHARALLALASGDPAHALQYARNAAVRAERAGRTADLADALALSARLLFARGEKPSALRAATRAANEAEAAGITRARAHAALVLAALDREDGDAASAVARARSVAELAAGAGLPIERLVAAEAIEAIGVESSGDSDVRYATSATMSDAALEASARILSDLGLTAIRPYRVVSAGGSERFVADANPDNLRMFQRGLAVDGVREVIVRSGEQIADLRRRSLLKRLLFLFAGAPGQIFSKEEIVEKVWQVEYHPLRHDAALFTNIMRIRRLLGKDGADLIRVSEDGYRFVPPKDYLYVENVEAK